MRAAERYEIFGRFEAADAPTYRSVCHGIVADDEILAVLDRLTERERQPNLVLAAVNHLGGMTADYTAFRTFLLERLDDLVALVRTRRTQTNEIGRCATLLPALGQLRPPLALIEVGASAGLNLLLDRYAYDYGVAGVLGDTSSRVVIPCELRNDVPLPEALPDVVWRRGIDIDPVDVLDDDAVAWLQSCVFVDHTDRLARLRAAIELARQDPPPIVEGDLVEEIAGAVADAPRDGTVVVFHSAVLAYLEPDQRSRFARIVRGLDVAWLSNEGPSVVRTLKDALHRPLPPELCFLLGRDGHSPLAFTHPHGRWVEWLVPPATP